MLRADKKMTEMDKIHIAFAAYDPKGTYSRHVGVAMASALYNSTCPVCVHILHDDTLSQDNKNKLTLTLENIGNKHNLSLRHEIDFINLKSCYKNCEADLKKFCRGFSIGTTYYINLPEVLPNESRVIFLDSDTVTTLDILELWETDLKDNFIAAVRDTGDSVIHGVECPSPRSHINTGVQLLDLEKIRAKIQSRLLERFLKYVQEYRPYYIEQEFMSAEFYGKILFLDERFNVLEKHRNDNLSEGKIWHFAQRKPWVELIGKNSEILYWEYLQKTAWKDELVGAFYLAATNGGHLHRHTSDCFKRMWQNIVRETKKALAKLAGSKEFIE